MHEPAGESLTIRPMRWSDIGATTRLKQQAGWNQTHADWRRFLAISSGSFVAVRRGQVIGSVTSCAFGCTAWIGMMLVDVAHRRQGIATRLMRTVLAHVEQSGCESVWLDATALGAPVYRRLGFRDQYEVARWGGQVQSRSDLTDWICTGRPRPFHWPDWAGVRTLDAQALGADRTKLLKRLILEHQDRARVVVERGQLAGYALQRAGSTAQFIGPIAAHSVESGRALLADALQQARRVPVKLDLPRENRPAIALAAAAGLTEQRRFIRMVRGAVGTGAATLLWASSGPEKG